MCDNQLAIAVARVYEGDDGSVLKELLKSQVLPQAARDGNRWLATWAFWMLGEKHKSLRALVEPLEDLVPLQDPPPPNSKHYSNTEPSLVHFYAMLREKIQRTPGDKTPLLNPTAEHTLVMRSAMCYVRAGCDSLALALVRDWRYTAVPKREMSVRLGIEEISSAPQESGSDDGDESGSEVALEPAVTSLAGTTQRKKVSEEPSAASIMDNFNF